MIKQNEKETFFNRGKGVNVFAMKRPNPKKNVDFCRIFNIESIISRYSVFFDQLRI